MFFGSISALHLACGFSAKHFLKNSFPSLLNFSRNSWRFIPQNKLLPNLLHCLMRPAWLLTYHFNYNTTQRPYVCQEDSNWSRLLFISKLKMTSVETCPSQQSNSTISFQTKRAWPTTGTQSFLSVIPWCPSLILCVFHFDPLQFVPCFLVVCMYVLDSCRRAAKLYKLCNSLDD